MKDYRGYYEIYLNVPFTDSIFYTMATLDELVIEDVNVLYDAHDNSIKKCVFKHEVIGYSLTVTYDDGTISSISALGTTWMNDLQNFFGTNNILGIAHIFTNSNISLFLLELERCFDRTKTCYFLYRLNSAKNVVSKSLVFVESDFCVFNTPISHKSMELTMTRTANDFTLKSFNYLYLTVLERFYFVDKTLLTKNIMNLTIVEDVLMSFADLIRSQIAFVTRNENIFNNDLVDDEIHMDGDKSINYTIISPTNDLFDITNNLDVGSFILTTVG